MKPTRQRPLSITLVALLFILGGVYEIVFSFLGIFPSETLLELFDITQGQVDVYNALFGAVALAAGIGLWRLNNVARWIAIVLEGINLLSALVFVVILPLLSPEMEARSINLPAVLVSHGNQVALSIIVLGLLVEKRALFIKSTESKPT